MVSPWALALALCAGTLALAATHESKHKEGSPAAVSKVISMLLDMSTKAKAEKNAEQVAYSQFGSFCAMQKAELTKTIADKEALVEVIDAKIGKLTAEAKDLGEEIATLNSDVAGYGEDKKEAEAQRAKDHAGYLAEVMDYSESIDALERAISVLESKNRDVPGAAAALLQLPNKVDLPTETKEYIGALMSALQSGSGKGDFTDASAPEADAYEFQSGGIINTLKNLLDKFTEKKGECQKEEMNAAHASAMVIHDLSDSIENAKGDIISKSKVKEEKEGEAALLKGQLSSTSSTLQEDKKALSDISVECTEKGMSFEEKQRLRTEEIEAIEKAIEILSGSPAEAIQVAQAQVAAAAKAPALIQIVRSVAKSNQKEQGIKRKLIKFITSEGHRLNSKSMELLAQKLEDPDLVVETSMISTSVTGESADPFAKVKKLIWDLIQHMEEEANQDASHEGWCDTEMGKSKVTRNKLNEELDALSAEIEEGKANIAMLAEEIAHSSQESAELSAAMDEATKLRTEEKTKNEATIADAQASQKAVTAATTVLGDFYKKAQIATALVQQKGASRLQLQSHSHFQRPKMGTEEWKALANPAYEGSGEPSHEAGQQTFGATYSGNQDAAGGVMALLECILADFANLESDTTAAESLAQREYEDYMAECKKDEAVKARKRELDSADKASALAKLQSDTADLKATEDELLAADRYYEKLSPQCVQKGVSFKDRAAQRQAEIQSLREALKILST